METTVAQEVVSNLSSSVNNALSQTLSPFMGIIKTAGILFIAYLVFLIIKGLFAFRDSARLSRISKNVDEINKKLALVLADKEKPQLIIKNKIKEKK
jgi:hypothetical protein